MLKHQATVCKRDLSQSLKAIRRDAVVANIYGPKIDSIPVQMDYKEFDNLYNQVGESTVAYLKLDKKEYPVLIDEVQRNPVTDLPLHVVFRMVDLKEKITAAIPVEVIGEIDIPEAVLVVVKDEIEVEALPTDLPEKFELSVSGLTEIGQSLTLADLSYDRSKVTLVLDEDEEETAPVVLIQEVKEEVEEVEPVETEIIGKAETEEAPAETAETKPEQS
ncbi:MAG TPA: 50S ribosomal protein L25 [Candidatus Woesebacteria bacterium]|nr:50S ribosomal protein L25 [Candidatus Woesebacteria bacterium]